MKSVAQNNGAPARKSKPVDAIEAQNVLLRHAIITGDGDDLRDLRRNVTPEHFSDANTRAIAEVLWSQFEAGATIDADSIGAALRERDFDAYTYLLEMLPSKSNAASFKDSLHAVLNGDRTPSKYFETFTFKDLKVLPRPQWLVRRLLVEKTTSVLSADSGHFKSFIALEMALCITTGTDFHGHEVKQGAAVYVAAEGFYTVYERAAAWSLHNAIELPENLHVLKVPVNLRDAITVQKFIDSVAEIEPAFIVLDTLSQCAIGANENDNAEMADFVRGMQVVGTRIGAHVQVLHHNAKSTGAFRGAGSIKANVDAHISLERPEGDELNTVFVRCVKQRGKPFEAFALRGQAVELPEVDEFGEPVTSLVFERSTEVVGVPSEKHANKKRAEKTRTALLEVFDRVAAEAASHGVDGVKSGFWLKAVEAAEPPICKSTAFWEHRAALEKSGFIREDGTHNGSVLYRRTEATPTTPTTPFRSDRSSADSSGKEYSDNSGIPLGTGVGGVPTAEVEVPATLLPEMPEASTVNSKADSEPYTVKAPARPARKKVRIEGA